MLATTPSRAPIVPGAPTLVRSLSAAQPGAVPLGTDGSVVGYVLAPDRADAESIVNHLQGFVDVFGRTPQVRAAAEAVLRSTRDNDLAAHARALLAWVKERVKYLPDPDGAEWIVSPLVQLDRIAAEGFSYGDCDDHVLLLGALLQSIGIPATVHAVKIRPSDPWFNHVILSARLPSGDVDMDPCAKGLPVANYPVRLVPAGK